MSIDFLSSKNKHLRDNNISFQEEGHIYDINGDKTYTSVTTWIHSLFEHFDADKIIDKMMNSKNWTNNKYYGKTSEEIKNIWEINRDISAKAGTKLHYDIECTYNNIKVDNDSQEFKYFLDFYEDYKNTLEPFRTEMLVYYEELKLSGSIDMIFKCKDGTYEIYDWKRSKEILKSSNFNKWIKSEVVSHIPDTNYWHYSLQLNTYKYILQKKYDMKVGNLYLVVLHPDNNKYLRIKAPDLQDEIQDLFEERTKNI